MLQWSHWKQKRAGRRASGIAINLSASIRRRKVSLLLQHDDEIRKADAVKLIELIETGCFNPKLSQEDRIRHLEVGLAMVLRILHEQGHFDPKDLFSGGPVD